MKFGVTAITDTDGMTAVAIGQSDRISRLTALKAADGRRSGATAAGAA
jgi:hypothetical protein